MAYLNNEQAIRRQLVEKIESLESKLAQQNNRISEQESVINEYSKKCDRLNFEYDLLIDKVSKAALKIPRDHRRQIMNVLPNQ